MERVASRPSPVTLAIRLAEFGFAVFPCREVASIEAGIAHRAKSPYTAHGLSEATTDVEQLATWWGQWPGALVGVNCGQSGLVVLDIDRKVVERTGEIVDGFEAIAARGLAVPATLSYTSTSGNGEHHIFAGPVDAPGPAQDVAGLRGVDRRSGGSYVIWAGDVPTSRTEFAAAPAWLLEGSRRQASGAAYEGTVREWLNALPTGPADREAQRVVEELTGVDIKREAMLNAQSRLVSIAAEGRPIGDAIDLARAEYLREPWDTPHHAGEWDVALAGAVRKFGGARKRVSVSTWSGEAAIVAHPSASVVSSDGASGRVWPRSWDDVNLHSHRRLAARFAQLADGRLLWVHGAGWHAWDGSRWASDLGEVAANGTLRALLERSWGEALADPALQRDVKSCNTAAGGKGVLDIASRDPRLFAPEVDADPWILNTRSGTLDLHTLELRPHDPADRITKVTRGVFSPHAAGADWPQFLESTLPDPDVRGFLQRWAGVALIGQVIEHKLVVAIGSGRNGKGVLANAIGHALGDYAGILPSSLLTANKYGETGSDLAAMADLRGVRWVVASEVQKGSRLNEERMKRLTGGDPLKARQLYQAFVTFQPSHSITMLANDLPEADSAATAVWARILAVPFTESFHGREDGGLADRLAGAADEVLTWAVEGLRDYRDRGSRLDPPVAVRSRTDRYRADNDPVRRFVAEECDLGAEHEVMKGVLFAAYNAWAAVNRAPQFTATKLGTEIKAVAGVGERKSGSHRYTGIELKDPTESSSAGKWQR